MNWQYITVGIIFALAVVYLVVKLNRDRKGQHNCGNGNCAAHPAKEK